MALSKHQEETSPTQTSLPSVLVRVSPIKAEFGLQNTSRCTCRRKLTGWFGDLTGTFVKLTADSLGVRGNELYISFLCELNIPGVCTGSSWDGVNLLHSI